MRIKLDENLPVELAEDLRRLGHEVDTAFGERLAGRPDTWIAEAARRAERCLFTLDKGLGDLRRFPPARYAGIIVFRLAVKGRRSIRRSVLKSMRAIATHEPVARALLVVTESSIRVRR
jgi:predicted nuclease of predicted toxin-antitoxin system